MRLQTGEHGAVIRRAFALMRRYRDHHEIPEGSAISLAYQETLVELDMVRERQAKEKHRTDQPRHMRQACGKGE